MENDYRKHISALLIVLGGMIVLGGGSQLVLGLILKQVFPNDLNPLDQFSSATQIILNSVVSILMFYVPVAIVSRLYYTKHVQSMWMLNKAPVWKLVPFAIIALLVSSPFLVFLQNFMNSFDFIKQFSPNDEIVQKAYAKILKIDSIPSLMISLIGIAIIPAVVEEIVFRGFFQRIFIKLTKSPLLGILIASIFFSAVHLQVAQFPLRVVLGFILGLIFYTSGSLWTAILAHAFNNGFIVIQAYLINKTGEDPSKLLEEQSMAWYYALASLLSLSILCVIIWRKRDQSIEHAKLD